MKCEECFTDEDVSYSDHYSCELCMDCYNERSEAEENALMASMENDE